MEPARVRLLLVSRFMKLQSHWFLTEISMVFCVTVLNLGSSDSEVNLEGPWF